MKTYKLIALAAAFSLTLTAFPLLVMGDDAAYDPENDPLVSLSYITEVLTPAYEKKIAELTGTVDELTETISTMHEALEELEDQLSDSEKKRGEADERLAELEAALSESAGSTLGGFEVVYMKKGAKLLAESPCEIILRSGSAIVVSITVNGLNNVTDGTELLNAVEVPLFNQLLVPRGGDGRGIQITSEDSYVMVRGDYSIVE